MRSKEGHLKDCSEEGSKASGAGVPANASMITGAGALSKADPASIIMWCN